MTHVNAPLNAPRTRALGLAALVAGGLGLAGPAAAAPLAPAPLAGETTVRTVAGGCGPGFHPNPWGVCRPNWAPGPTGALGPITGARPAGAPTAGPTRGPTGPTASTARAGRPATPWHRPEGTPPRGVPSAPAERAAARKGPARTAARGARTVSRRDCRNLKRNMLLLHISRPHFPLLLRCREVYMRCIKQRQSCPSGGQPDRSRGSFFPWPPPAAF